MAFLRKFAAYLRANWGLILEYRASMLIWMASGLMPLIMMAIWLTLAAEGPVGGYSASDFVAYYLAAIFVRQMTAVWVEWELDYQIRQGTLSALLLRPIHPIVDHIGINLADKLFRIPLIVPVLAVAALLTPGQQYDLSLPRVLLFGLTLALGWGIIFTSHFIIGTLSFWMTQATAFSQLWFGLRMLLSGVIAPLSLFPAAIAQVAQVLPFRFMLSFPVEVLTGQLSARAALNGLLLQVGWLTLFVIILVFVWRQGVRAFSAVGA